jgi:hypothetical protein
MVIMALAAPSIRPHVEVSGPVASRDANKHGTIGPTGNLIPASRKVLMRLSARLRAGDICKCVSPHAALGASEDRFGPTPPLALRPCAFLSAGLNVPAVKSDSVREDRHVTGVHAVGCWMAPHP